MLIMKIIDTGVLLQIQKKQSIFSRMRDGRKGEIMKKWNKADIVELDIKETSCWVPYIPKKPKKPKYPCNPTPTPVPTLTPIPTPTPEFEEDFMS